MSRLRKKTKQNSLGNPDAVKFPLNCLIMVDLEVEPCTMEDPDYGKSVLNGVSKLWAENLLFDYTLVAQDKAFQVHKVLLASVSDYFMAVFRSGMQEVCEDSLNLKGVSSKGLESVVEYLYEGKLTLHANNILDVVATAAHLQILSMSNLCTQFLINEITMENIKDMQQICQMFYLQDLRKAIQEFILQHFTKFAKTNYFKQLPLSEVCKLLKDNRLCCQSEYKLFKQVWEWVGYAKENRELVVANVLQHIRLPYMTKEELAVIQKLSFIKKDPICRSILEKAVYFKMHPRQQVLLKGPWTEIRSEPFIITFGCSNQAMHSCVLYKDDWFPLNKALGQPRPFLNSAAIVVNNFLFVCGGCHIRMSNLCFTFNPVNAKWTSLQSMNKPRRNFALAAVNNYIFAIGGLCDNNEVTDTVEMYDIEKDVWTFTTPLPYALADVAAITHGNMIYVAGGSDENCHQLKDFRAFNTRTKHWEPRSDLLGIKFSPRLFAKDGNLYLVDLHKTEGACARMDVYNIAKDQWKTIDLKGVHFSHTFGAAMVNDWIYFVGRNDVDDGKSKKYNIASNELQDTKAYPWAVEAPICCTLQLPSKLLQKKMLVENA